MKPPRRPSDADLAALRAAGAAAAAAAPAMSRETAERVLAVVRAHRQRRLHGNRRKHTAA